MGLNLSLGNFHCSYSRFMWFRRQMAASIGIDLDEMVGFGPKERPWEDFETPLMPFFNHSDCDGELSVDECKQILPHLKLLQEIQAATKVNSYEFSWLLTELVESIETAIAASEPLEFY